MMDKKIARMYAKWNNVSRRCYELKQHTNPIFIRNCSCPAYVRKYIKAYKKAEKLSNKLKNLQAKRENFRKKHSTTHVK